MLSVGSLMDSPSVSGCPTTTSNFVWKYCRMCALEVKQGVYIFGEEGRRLHIPEKIRKTVAILVLEEDTLPKKICTSCCTHLEAYNQFKDSVVDAQEKLSSIAKSIEKSQEQSLLHFRSRQQLGSSKRLKLYHSSANSQSGNHALVPAPSLMCAETDFGDPPVECDELHSPIVSSDEEEAGTSSKAAPECSAVAEVPSKDDNQEPLLGSPPLPIVKQTSVTSGSISPENASSGSSSEPFDINASKSENTVSSESQETTKEAHLICGLCITKAKDKEFLVAHHTGHHKEVQEPVFGCSVCPRTSNNYEAIRQHIYRHRMTGAFKCVDCDHSYSTKDQLDVHVSSKHNPGGSKSFICNTCGKQYGTNVALAAHKRKKHGQTDESEAVPGKSDATSLSSRPKNLVESNDSPAKPVVANTSKADKIPGNQERTHSLPSSTEPVVADISHNDNGPETENNLATERLDKDKVTKEEGYWKCGYCDKILQSKYGYETHIAVHKGRRYTCEYCGVTYTQKTTLEHHIKVHHTNVNKEFECPECKKRFKTLRQLGSHKKTHEKPLTDIKCPQCEKKFLNLISLKTHMKLHRGSKNFPCQQCPKSFYTKLKLEEHLNSHTGKRPFGCPTSACCKVFSCFSNYAKHFKKHHYELLGPRGNMIPQPKITDNCDRGNSANASDQKSHKKADGSKTKDVVTLIVSLPATTSHTHEQPPNVQVVATTATCESESQTRSATTQQSHVSTPQIISTQNATSQSVSTRPSFGIVSASVSSSASNLQLPSIIHSTLATSSQVTSGSSTLSSGNAAHCNTVNSTSTATSETQSHQIMIPHHQSAWASNGPSHTPAHQHLVHAHPIHVSHLAHSHSAPSGPQNQQTSQFQQQCHIQSVWQPVVSNNSKIYHHTNSSGLATINGLDLLEYSGNINAHPSEPLAGGSISHSQQGSLSVIPSVSAAHLSTPTHSTHHPIHSTVPNGPSIHGNNHGIPSSHSNNIPVSSSNSNLTVPNFVPSQQNEPMELSYKLDSSNFQEMPMELTKVFQRDPLELCVRQDFQQPLMDLSSRVVNASVGGNPSATVSTLSLNMNGSGNSSNNQSHYGSVNATNTSTVISVPYHKTVEMVERELSLNDFTGAFRQPIDLISRNDDQSHELCSEGNLVDLSLRSGFPQDHSASSFLRELIDLSSRSDSFHGEINLTNKPQHPPQPSSHSHSQQLHNHSHGSVHHPTSKGGNTASSHHHHHSHHNHHHHHPQSSQHGNGSGNVTFQNVLYQDTMFGLQN